VSSGGRSGRTATRTRSALIAELSEAARDMAGWTLMLHQAIAARFGLGPTDMKCLDLARDEHDLTAGRIAEITGLSTSAVTSAVDRLEKRGFVTRERDPDDRRKVLIRPTGAHDAEAAEIFDKIGTRFAAVVGDYTDAELALINGFVRRVNAGSREVIPEVTGRGAAPGR
jgi:DNA-binding MarR family transcriptional regulator